jgi:hypothetical protein
VRGPAVIEQHIDAEDRVRVVGNFMVKKSPLQRVAMDAAVGQVGLPFRSAVSRLDRSDAVARMYR